MRFLLNAIVLWIFVCKATAQDPPSPPRVKVIKPIEREVVLLGEYPGHFEAVEEVKVRAQVSGWLDKILFHAGQKVHAGQLLFVIDQRPFKIRLQQAEAELAMAQASLELARTQLARAEKLLAKKFLSQEEYDLKRAELLAAQAQVKAKTAQVEEAKLNLSFTEIRAPIPGIVEQERITVGNLVKGGGADATVLTAIVREDPIYAYFEVDERAAVPYPSQPEAKVELGLAFEQGFPHQARLDYASPRLDWNSGTRTLRAVLPNPDGKFKPGAFVRVRLAQGPPFRALLVPERAIVKSLAETGVWVVDAKRTVSFRPVVLGPLVDAWQAVREGLQADDRVVVEGVQKLQPGMEVLVEEN
jgi:RND family efflux transporter MFP subunit